MKIRKTAGLVGAGGVNQSFVARMPALLERLGPVKGSSLRVSRRIANGFRAGSGVSDYAALQGCELIWMFGHESALDHVIAELAGAVCLEGKMVVLCEVMRDSLGPSPLRTARARVATLNCIPESGERTFVSEGHPAVVTELRKLLALDGKKLIELRPAAKILYLSGVHLGAHLLMPWIAGAVESFRAAGFSRSEAVQTVQALGARALRAYAKAGAKAWNRAAAESLRRVIEADIETIRLTDHRLAALHTAGTERLLQSFATASHGERLAKATSRRAS
jgi:hypothetical protein